LSQKMDEDNLNSQIVIHSQYFDIKIISFKLPCFQV